MFWLNIIISSGVSIFLEHDLYGKFIFFSHSKFRIQDLIQYPSKPFFFLSQAKSIPLIFSTIKSIVQIVVV